MHCTRRRLLQIDSIDSVIAFMTVYWKVLYGVRFCNENQCTCVHEACSLGVR